MRTALFLALLTLTQACGPSVTARCNAAYDALVTRDAEAARALGSPVLLTSMTYDQLRAVLGEPASIEHDQDRHIVSLHWAPGPNPDRTQATRDCVANDDSIAVDRALVLASFIDRHDVGSPFRISVRAPFGGTLEGYRVGEDVRAQAVRDGWRLAEGRDRRMYKRGEWTLIVGGYDGDGPYTHLAVEGPHPEVWFEYRPL